MAVTLYDLSSSSGLKKLDEYLLPRSYITGYVTAFMLRLYVFFFFINPRFLSDKQALMAITVLGMHNM